MSQPTPSPAPMQGQLWIVWGALLSSLVVYVGVALSLPARTPGDVPLDLYTWLLGAIALVAAAGAHFFHRRSRGAGRAVHEGPPPPGVAFTNALLAWVIDESVGVFGLALAVLGAPVASWSAFVLGAGILLLVHRPGQAPIS